MLCVSVQHSGANKTAKYTSQLWRHEVVRLVMERSQLLATINVTTLAKSFTYEPLLPRSIIWHWAKGDDSIRLARLMAGLGESCLTAVLPFVIKLAVG